MKLFVILSLIASSSFALECYDCGFSDAFKCRESVDLGYETCEEPTESEAKLGVKSVCIKIMTTDANGVQHFNRSCSRHGGPIKPCLELAEDFDKSYHCSVCGSDLCNGGELLLPEISGSPSLLMNFYCFAIVSIVAMIVAS